MTPDPQRLREAGDPMASLLRDVRVEDLGEAVDIPPWPDGGMTPGASSSGTSVAKLVLLAAVVLLAGVVTVALRGEGTASAVSASDERTQVAVNETSVSTPPRVVEAEPRVEEHHVAAKVKDSAPIESSERSTPAMDTVPPRSGSSPKSPRARARAPKAPPEHEPAGEVELVAQMRASLAREPSRTLQLAREGQRRFPQGMFVRERRAYEVFSLHALGRTDEAATLARRFARRYPTGPLSERVSALLPSSAASSEANDRAQQ